MKKKTLLVSALSVFLLALSACELTVPNSSQAPAPESSSAETSQTNSEASASQSAESSSEEASSSDSGPSSSQTPATQYTITFDANGGAGTMASVSKQDGETYTLPTCGFTKEGYHFDYWLVGTSTTHKNVGDEITVYSNLTVKVMWAEDEAPVVEKVTVNFNANGADGHLDSMPDQLLDKNSEYTLPECTFTYTDHYFTGWYVGGETTLTQPGEKITVTENVALQAQWGEVTLTSISVVNAKEQYYVGDAFDKSQLTVTAHYQGASDAVIEASQYEVTEFDSSVAVENQELTVTYQTVHTNITVAIVAAPVTQHTITFNANEGSGSMGPVEKAHGSTYALPECTFTRDNYHFTGWQIGEDTTPRAVNYVYTVVSDITIKALWAIDQVTVSFNNNGGSGSIAPQVVDKGSNFELPECTFTAPSGKQFKHWRIGDGPTTKNPEESVVVSADTVIYAIWEDIPTYTVSFNAGGGSGTMSPVAGVHGSYTLPANSFIAPAAGKEFDCWVVNEQDKAVGESINVTANVTVTAKWKDIADGFYLAGSFNNWKPTTADKLTYDSENAKHHTTLELHQGDQFLITQMDGGSYYYYKNVGEDDGDTKAITYKGTTPSALYYGYLAADEYNHNFKVVVPGTYYLEYKADGVWTQLCEQEEVLQLDKLEIAKGTGAYSSTGVNLNKDNAKWQYEYHVDGITINEVYNFRWASESTFTVELGNTAVPYFNLNADNKSVTARTTVSDVNFYFVLQATGNVVLHAYSPAGVNVYALVGTMNSWDETDTTSYAFAPSGENQVTLSSVQLSNEAQFKICINGAWANSLDYTNLDEATKALKIDTTTVFTKSDESNKNIVVNATRYYNIVVNTSTGAITITIVKVSISRKPTNDGAATVDQIDKGQNYTLPANSFVIDHKEFKGWTVDETLRQPGYVLENVTSDTVIVADWYQLYDVTFDENGGTGSMSTVVTRGEYALPTNDFTAPSGKQFKCWSVNAAEKLPTETIDVTANVTVTAIWEDIPAVTFTVTYKHGEGATGDDVVVNDIAGDYALAAANTFAAPSHKIFKAWSINAVEHAAGSHITVSGNVEAMAIWEEYYVISFDKNGGTDTMADDHSVAGNYTLPACTFTALDNCVFKAWKVSETEYNVGDPVTIAADTTVKAVWKLLYEGSINNTTPMVFTASSISERGEDTWAYQYKATVDVNENDTLTFKYNNTGIDVDPSAGDNNAVTVTAQQLKVHSSKNGATLYFKIYVNELTSERTYQVWLTDYQTHYSIIGGIGEEDWDTDHRMTVSDGVASVTITLARGDTFKIREDEKWDTTYGTTALQISDANVASAFSGSGNIFVEHGGTYTISFNTSTKKIDITGTPMVTSHIYVGSSTSILWFNDTDSPLIVAKVTASNDSVSYVVARFENSYNNNSHGDGTGLHYTVDTAALPKNIELLRCNPAVVTKESLSTFDGTTGVWNTTTNGTVEGDTSNNWCNVGIAS